MRTLFLALLCLISVSAYADQPKGLEPLPDAAPPVVGGEKQPQVTTKEKNGEKIEEYRMHGHLYMIKVTPANGGPSYYLVDMNGDGKFVRQAPRDSTIRPPMWVIHRF